MIAYYADDHVVQPRFEKREEDAGYDLYASIPIGTLTVDPGSIVHIETGIHVRVPDGHAGIVKERSSYPYRRQGLIVYGGVIDSGFSGPVMVFVGNTGTRPLVIDLTKAVAQMIFLELYEEKAVRVFSRDIFDSLFANKERKAGMAGSTDQ